MSALNPLYAHLHDLLRHMSWADCVFFGVWAESGQQDEPGLLQRVQHSADVQRAFLGVLHGDGAPFPAERPEPEFQALRALTRSNHDGFGRFYRGLEPDGLERSLRVPWFPGPPCHVSVAEVLTQVAMHTQHHRGQLMARLKELGGKPVNVDFILWAWQQRPEGRW
jgi:uncharacterized damage-inducible protein DinB